MTNAKSTHITLILDRSGSMGDIQDDIIGGVNAFFATQAAQDGPVTATLVQFDGQDPFELLADNVPVAEVLSFEQEYLAYLRHNTKVLEVIAETGQFSEDTVKAAEDALVAFRKQWVSKSGDALAEGDPAAEAIADADLSREQIVVKKKRS